MAERKSWLTTHPHIREMLSKYLKYILIFGGGLVIFFALYSTVDQDTFQELVKSLAKKVGLLERLPPPTFDVEPN